jgi:uncharacterized coiled-coil DUF342 family protein
VLNYLNSLRNHLGNERNYLNDERSHLNCVRNQLDSERSYLNDKRNNFGSERSYLNDERRNLKDNLNKTTLIMSYLKSILKYLEINFTFFTLALRSYNLTIYNIDLK